MLKNGVAKRPKRGITAVFSALGADKIDITRYTEMLANESEGHLVEISATTTVKLEEGKNTNRILIWARATRTARLKNVLKCLDKAVFDAEFENIKKTSGTAR
ncbi:MAG: hypothetical protein L6V93_11595 [Clostridiales bacterium]|nr:MAG: hypothetical protein L6V93_11595 [Clostridiales bacterium]